MALIVTMRAFIWIFIAASQYHAAIHNPIFVRRTSAGFHETSLLNSTDSKLSPFTHRAVSNCRGGHCMVPCGIFDDPMIVAEIKQCLTTVKKAMAQIKELEKNGTPNAQDLNQIVRWINTKEDHANKIISLIAEYCLCQRVKKEIFSTDSDYVDALKAHHAVMQAAMKCKQSVSDADAHNLEHAIDDFEKMYMPQE